LVLKFPILTSPISRRSDFLDEFQNIVDSDFKELIVISPFVDVFIIENILRRCIFKDRKMLIATRYGSTSLSATQRKDIDKAIDVIVQYESKDIKLPEKVRWIRNEKLHAKFIIKDWETVLFGSQNITQFGGLRGNYELGARIDGSEYVEKLRPFVEDIKRGAKRKPFYPR